jgi:hypothetical protein
MEKVSQQQIILGKGFFPIKLVQFWKLRSFPSFSGTALGSRRRGSQFSQFFQTSVERRRRQLFSQFFDTALREKS